LQSGIFRVTGILGSYVFSSSSLSVFGN